jgi:hypothetical protein
MLGVGTAKTMSRKRSKPFSFRELNSWRANRHCLDHPYSGKSIPKLVRSIGWLHSPGCSTPYLSLWARMSGFKPDALHRAVHDGKLIPVETLRGVGMLVPTDDVAVALRVRTRTFTELADQAADILPLGRREMDRLKTAILSVLESGARTDAEVEDRVPSSLVREFPSTLRRIGMTSSVRLAINLLKEEGRILKISAGRRLDSDDSRLVLLSELCPGVEPQQLKPEMANAELARIYFRTEGPARIKDFAWWSGLHVTVAMQAVEALGKNLAAVAVAGSHDEFLACASDLEELHAFKPPTTPSIGLIPYRDVFLRGHREVAARFVDPKHADKPFGLTGARPGIDPVATVVQDGEIIGIWEWKEPTGIDFVLFNPKAPASVETAVRKHAKRLERFVQDNLGHIEFRADRLGRPGLAPIRDLEASWSVPPQVHAARA